MMIREKLERTDSNFQELGILKNDHKNLSDDLSNLYPNKNN